jgi:hypothetical protein
MTANGFSGPERKADYSPPTSAKVRDSFTFLLKQAELH